MDSQKAREAFEEYLQSNNLTLPELNAAQGIETIIAFYQEERSAGDDEDDLLFQWGAYDWGEGKRFEVNITRQFVIGGEAEDDNIWQLSLTFKYVLTEELREIEDGNRWCGTLAPRGVEYFHPWILNSPGYQAVEGKQPDRVVLDFECAG